jgi:putative ATP-dependent endonuclease of the OLD family
MGLLPSALCTSPRAWIFGSGGHVLRRRHHPAPGQPHTQRRIADYLLLNTKQAFVTSHSPYVIERFTPENTFLLTRSAGGNLESMCVADATGLKENDYKRYARRGLSECMFGRGVIIVEGATEFHALPVLACCLEAHDAALNPLDLAGVTIFDAESDGTIPKFAKFFQALGLKTFGFYDAKQRTVAEKAKFAVVLDVNEEHPYKGFEEMLATEIPAARLRAFLQDLLNRMRRTIAAQSMHNMKSFRYLRHV